MTDKELTLDPEQWSEMRRLGHQMVDDMMNYLENVSNTPVWKSMPDKTKKYFEQSVPLDGSNVEDVYEEFKENILPFTQGNIHPKYFAWIQGSGTPLTALADFLASTMNPNASIGDHAARYVDSQIIEWMKQILNFPSDGSGIILSGSSMANITALTVARNQKINENIRKEGIKLTEELPIIYCSTETHNCIQKAVEIIGLGSNSLRRIEVNSNYCIDVQKLKKQIEFDIESGLRPICIIGNAGTVNTGAIDPLEEMLEISRKYDLWFHIDGAYGALAKLSDLYCNSLKAIELADSVAFDLHKWLHVPYDVGCVLFKDKKAHHDSFVVTQNYLQQKTRGLSGGIETTNNYGFELSRGFKALKVWMTLKEHGVQKFAKLIEQNIYQAKYLEKLVLLNTNLELVAPVSLSIVCFRYTRVSVSDNELNEINKEIVILLQEKGLAAPSSTFLLGKYVIRVCIVNHRTTLGDIEKLIENIISIGNQL
jgi:aromatic-L-amino-acid/L-tryptophan decarboxylase